MNSRRSFLRAVVSATALASVATIPMQAWADDMTKDDTMPRAEGTTGTTGTDTMRRTDESRRSEDSRRMGEVIDDQTLETKVKSALIGADEVKARNIEVEVRDGVTYLSGNVDSTAEAKAAVTTAQRVSGVKSVKSNLIVQRQQ